MAPDTTSSRQARPVDVHRTAHPPTKQDKPFSETRTGLDHIGLFVPSRADLDAWEARRTELAVEHSPVNGQPGYSVLTFRDLDHIQLVLMAMG